ncbi:MAG: hypothetical protein KF889_05365 [Alphaproteobacteria bacterium]|nr:hypothetical protein [Alphaproteobacteria bacterium]MCW5742298.1 hypothetical protein [Alphaproteobacteria bacterium]
MINRGILFWIVAAILTGIGLFVVKYHERRLEERLEALNREIVENQRVTNILRVEWAHLGAVNRIEALNARYIRLQPITMRQIGSIGQIPPRRAGGAIATDTGKSGSDAPSKADAPSASAIPRPAAARKEAGVKTPASAPLPAKPLVDEPVTSGIDDDDAPPPPPAARPAAGGRQ